MVKAYRPAARYVVRSRDSVALLAPIATDTRSLPHTVSIRASVLREPSATSSTLCHQATPLDAACTGAISSALRVCYRPDSVTSPELETAPISAPISRLWVLMPLRTPCEDCIWCWSDAYIFLCRCERRGAQAQAHASSFGLYVPYPHTP